MEWQDISTAPKDEEIIGFNGKEVTDYCWRQTPDDFGYAGWCVSTYSYGGVLYELHNKAETQPTYWMPLPPPPKA